MATDVKMLRFLPDAGDKSPSDILRSHIYFKGTIAGNSNNEPSETQFHHKRLEMIRALLRKFKEQNNRNPTTERVKHRELINTNGRIIHDHNGHRKYLTEKYRKPPMLYNKIILDKHLILEY